MWWHLTAGYYVDQRRFQYTKGAAIGPLRGQFAQKAYRCSFGRQGRRLQWASGSRATLSPDDSGTRGGHCRREAQLGLPGRGQALVPDRRAEPDIGQHAPEEGPPRQLRQRHQAAGGTASQADPSSDILEVVALVFGSNSDYHPLEAGARAPN